MQVGCNTLLYGGHPLETALQHIQWAGYDGIELAAIQGMAEHAELGRPTSYARALRSLVDGYGLSIYHLGVHSRLSTPEGIERLRLGLRLAHELEVPLVLNASSGEPTPEGLTWASDTIGQLAREASVLGLKLGIKPHVGQAVHDTATARTLIETVRAPNLGLDFDISHSYRANEDPIESFRALAPDIFTLRIRDAHSREPRIGPPETQITGRGVLDLPGFLRAVKASGYAGDLSVDIVGTKGYPEARIMAIIAETRGYLRRGMQEVGL